MKRINLAAILILFLAVSLFHVDVLPGEMYGDVIQVSEWFGDVISGGGLPPFFLSVGPLYFYLFSPIVRVFGGTFLSLKTLSSIVGAVTILTTFFLAKKITRNTSIALVSCLLLAVSKWNVIHSRLGDHRIIILLFAVLSYTFLLKYLSTKSFFHLVILSVITGLSFYTYIPAWAIPFSIAISLTLSVYLGNFTFRERVKTLLVYLVIIAFISYPLVKNIQSDRSNFFGGGYIGSKFFEQGKINLAQFPVFIENLKKTLFMFHLRGDQTFRVNPPGEPHLDIITGALFLFGLVHLVISRRYLSFTILPIFILLLPASFVLTRPEELPSSARTLAVVPFVMIVSGIGFWSIVRIARNVLVVIPIRIFLSTIFIILAFLNLRSYFITYAHNLPNKNTPFGKIIGKRIDDLSDDARIYMVGCCWADAGQPEPKAILLNLTTKKDINFFEAHDNPEEFTCNDIIKDIVERKNLYFIVNPNFSDDIDEIQHCFPGGREEMIHANGFDIAWSYLYSSSSL